MDEWRFDFSSLKRHHDLPFIPSEFKEIPDYPVSRQPRYPLRIAFKHHPVTLPEVLDPLAVLKEAAADAWKGVSRFISTTSSTNQSWYQIHSRSKRQQVHPPLPPSPLQCPSYSLTLLLLSLRKALLFETVRPPQLFGQLE